jgi:N-acyl-D-aspartate/D-glutamate deacylase
MSDYDIVIRGGTVFDGEGGQPFTADVAVKDGKIAVVGTVTGTGAEEIDAVGKMVTPGFVDIHTHYDGQVTWDQHLSPSSGHGVTTVLMGNCGVGFAPCRADQRATMIDVMEGVEDIPGVVMAEGLPWTWETFPEYLDFLDTRETDVDFGAQVPHVPLRVYAMGKRGVNREPAKPADIATMKQLVKEGMEAGALGFSSSRSLGHRTASGDVVPSTTASEDELLGICLALKELGRGLIHTATDFDTSNGLSSEFMLLRRVAEATGRPFFFPLLEYPDAPDRWRWLNQATIEANAAGARMYGQVVGRPVGLLYGLELTTNPFSGSKTYQSIAHLPLAERLVEMKKPEVRAAILADEPFLEDERVLNLSRSIAEMYPMGNPPNYSPSYDDRFDVKAGALGLTDPYEVAYDYLLGDNGKAIIYHPARNFTYYNLDVVHEMLQSDGTVLGLGDGGAHLGRICDGSMQTFMLTYWTRDRDGPRLELPWVIRKMTSEPADIIGFRDRGRVKEGFKADLNVIDYEKLYLHPPHPVQDLPAGGTRLQQTADGYVVTILSGVVTFRGGETTGKFPGRLIRGERDAPEAQRELVSSQAG